MMKGVWGPVVNSPNDYTKTTARKFIDSCKTSKIHSCDNSRRNAHQEVVQRLDIMPVAKSYKYVQTADWKICRANHGSGLGKVGVSRWTKWLLIRHWLREKGSSFPVRSALSLLQS